jgi:hypothetical protein
MSNKRPTSEPRAARAELEEILKARPDLRGKSLEAAKRILRRERRLSLKPSKDVTLKRARFSCP